MNHRMHIYQVGYLTPLLIGLREAGVSLDNLLQRNMIGKFDLSDTEKYLPDAAVYEFLDDVKRDQGLTDLAATFHEYFKPDNIGDYGTYLKQMPNFLTLVQEGIKYEAVQQTNVRMAYHVNGPKTTFTCEFIDPIVPGKILADEMGLAMILEMFKMAIGSNWTPLELHFPGETIFHLESMLPKGNYPIRMRQPHYAVIFPTHFLSRKIGQGINDADSPELCVPANSFAAKLEQVMYTSLPGFVPNQNELSDYFNIPGRTLRRYLQTEGISFLELRERFLFTQAIDLLAHTNNSIVEISQRLQYANPSNFLRVFKKWTGMTPGAYRNLQ